MPGERIRWRKSGGGIHRHWDGQIVRRDEVLVATEFEVRPFRNLFTPIDPLPSEKVKREPEVGLKIVHRGGGRYNVINEKTGTPINDKLLTREQAEELVADG